MPIKESRAEDDSGEKELTLARQEEKSALIEALSKSGDNISKAAELLGCTRATVYNRVRKYNIKLKRPRWM
jgi:transcriptional regulator of acetoin/glycerol metabolism